MKSIIISLFMAIQFTGHTQSVLTLPDFTPLAGKWTGTLTYLDYSSNKMVSIPSNTLIELSGTDGYDQYIYYTAEPDKNKKTHYSISSDGQMLNQMKLTERKQLSDGSLELVLESSGPDGNDNRPARFRHIMLISEKEFVIRKMVKFEGEGEYFQRHEYRFQR